MKDDEYFQKGFSLLAEKTKHLEEVNELIINNNIDELENKLNEISALADKEKKQKTKQSIKTWLFIISSIVTIYLSIYFSAYLFFLSAPLSLLTIALLIFATKPIELFFIYDAGMKDYIDGIKKDEMKEPKYSYIYMEKRLQAKMRELKR